MRMPKKHHRIRNNEKKKHTHFEQIEFKKKKRIGLVN